MRTIVSLLEMVLVGFALISRCLPYGSGADTEPLRREGLRVGTMGEGAGDAVGDIAEVREEKERMNFTRRERGYKIPSPRRSLTDFENNQLVIPSSPLQVGPGCKSVRRENSDRFFYVDVHIDLLYERGSPPPLLSQ